MDLSATSIRHALVPSRIARRVQARRSLEDWLREADPRRYGLPANAVVLVRELRVTWAQVAGPAGSRREDALGTALRGAVRPALQHGATPDASAVWFADEAELLACMARDALAGPLSERWWWRALLRDEADRSAAMRHWVTWARAVPRAAGELQAMERGLGAAWFESWNASARTALIAGLGQHHPVSAAVRRFVESGLSEAGPVPRGAPATAVMDNGFGRGNAHERDGEPRVSSIQSASARLHRLCLHLLRDPACAFDERYVAREVRGEALSVVAEDGRFVDDSRAQTGGAPSAAIDPRGPRTAVPHAPGVADGRSRAGAGAHRRIPAQAGQAATWLERVEPAVPGVRPEAVSRRMPAEAREGTAPHVIHRGDAGPRVAHAHSAFDDATVFDTRYGGLFFVLNAALQLELYGDFSRPLHRWLDMSPWQFLYETGVAFGRRQFAVDPLGAWLKSGWNPEAESIPFDPAAAWRIDRDWLRPFDGDPRPLRAVLQAGRLTLLHPAGFAISSASATAAHCEHTIAGELAAFGLAGTPVVRVAASQRRSGSARRASGNIALARVLPYLRARLALALGLRDRRQLAAVLLRQPARTRVSGSRVDVFFALQHLPIAVRLSGLDRDPGWVPAAGRDLRFHFE